LRFAFDRLNPIKRISFKGQRVRICGLASLCLLSLGV
jgi:hypothetical protein